MPDVPLLFIDQGSVGPEARRLIRSHVMQGKNARRPRPIKRRQRDIVPVRRVLDLRPRPLERRKQGIPSDTHVYNHPLGLIQLLWDDLALNSFPHRLTSESSKLLHYWFLVVTETLYPPEFCARFDTINDVWTQSILLDEAYFHSVLAISASFVDCFHGNIKTSYTSLDHVSKAYQLTNQLLSGPEATSDRAIVAVTALAVYERLHYQHFSGLVHFDGLRKIIQLRGGVAKLAKKNLSLALKPWRLDIEFALQDGSTPRLFADDIAGSNDLLGIAIGETQRFVPGNVDLYDEISLELRSLMCDTAAFAKLLDSRNEGNRLQPLNYTESVLSLLHSLMSFAPLGSPRPNDQLENLTHLALLALMTTLLPDYGYKHSKYSLLSGLLRDALQRFSLRATSQGCRYMVWAILVGSVSVLESNDDRWVVPLLGEMCKRMNVQVWLDVRHILCAFPWISALHEKSNKAIWETLESKNIGGSKEGDLQ